MLLFEEMERLSRVKWPDVGMHAALTNMESLVSQKNAVHQLGNIWVLSRRQVVSLHPKDSILNFGYHPSLPSHNGHAPV